MSRKSRGLPQNRQDVLGRWVEPWCKESAALCMDILIEVASGKSLKEATFPQTPGRPRPATFLYWALTVPELGSAYKLAREISGHMLEDDALGIARRLEVMEKPDAGKVRALDVAMGQLRWSATKRNPKEYSDKAALQFTVPIQINTNLPLMPGEDMGRHGPNEEFRVELELEAELPAGAAGAPGAPNPEAALESPPRERTLLDVFRAPPGNPGKAHPKQREAMRRLWAEGRYNAETQRRPRGPDGRLQKATDGGDDAQTTQGGDLRGGPMAGRQERERVDQVGEHGPQGDEGGELPDPGLGGEADLDGDYRGGDDLAGQGGRAGGAGVRGRDHDPDAVGPSGPDAGEDGRGDADAEDGRDVK